MLAYYFEHGLKHYTTHIVHACTLSTISYIYSPFPSALFLPHAGGSFPGLRSSTSRSRNRNRTSPTLPTCTSLPTKHVVEPPLLSRRLTFYSPRSHLHSYADRTVPLLCSCGLAFLLGSQWQSWPLTNLYLSYPSFVLTPSHLPILLHRSHAHSSFYRPRRPPYGTVTPPTRTHGLRS